MTKRPHADIEFGGVTIFNERSTNATVMVQACTTRGVPVPVGQNGNSGMQSVSAGGSTTWSPAQSMVNVKSVMVDVYDADGQTRRVTFGRMGVGLQGALFVEEARITLSGPADPDGDVLVELGKTVAGSWTRSRAAQQVNLTKAGPKPNLTFQNTVQKLNGNGANVVLGTWNTDNQSGVIQIVPGQSNPTGYTTWVLKQVGTSPRQYQILTTQAGPTGPAAIGVWLDGAGPALVAGQVNPANSSAPPANTQLLLIQYTGSEPFGTGNYQIVSLDGGNAITSVKPDWQTQYRFLPPDSLTPPNQQQYFDVLGL